MDEATPLELSTRPLTQEEFQRAILSYWRQGLLWKLMGDPHCLHRWVPTSPYTMICQGECGGFLYRLDPSKP